MKRTILVLLTFVILVVMFASCSEHMCPAYSNNENIEQVENNS